MAFALVFTFSCSVISTCPRCHLDQRERSHEAIIRPKEGILGNKRFLASLDSGGRDHNLHPIGNDGISRSARDDKDKNVILTFLDAVIRPPPCH